MLIVLLFCTVELLNNIVVHESPVRDQTICTRALQVSPWLTILSLMFNIKCNHMFKHGGEPPGRDGITVQRVKRG